MTKRIGIDPSTPLLERDRAFLDLVRRARAESGDGERVGLAGGHRIVVSDRVAAALGAEGTTVNAQARGPVVDTAPSEPAQARAAEAEAERGVRPTKRAAAKKSTAKRTARKRAAKRATKKSTAKKATRTR